MQTDIWRDYFLESAVFNIQILPESLLCGIIILSILLANHPLMAVAAGGIVTQILTYGIGESIMAADPNSPNITVRSPTDICTSGYIGKSWERVLRNIFLRKEGKPEMYFHALAPSVYLATIGFFSGWGFALQQLYREEIDAGILSRATATTMLVLTILLLMLVVVYRTMSGCETFFGALAGLFVGLIAGYFICFILGYSTDRRATNVWGIPLLRDRINDGGPVYICPN
jgi:hypothetical protein